jgi:hypothetical protein
MKKLTTGIAALILLTGGTLYAQNNTNQKTPKEGKNTPTHQQSNTRAQGSTTSGTQSQGSSAQGTSAWPQATGATGAITPESQTPVIDTEASKSGSSTHTQTQGNSAGGTSAWPQASGTSGAIIPQSEADTSKTIGNGNTVSGANNPATQAGPSTDKNARKQRKEKKSNSDPE